MIRERPLTPAEHHAYLARIGLEPVRRPSAARLKALHRAHLAAVPFENFNRFLGRKINLSTGPLFRKLVTERRGGICYELNVGYALLLRAEGFDVEHLSAQMEMGSWTPEFDHLTLRVTLGDQHWLSDVGFGVVTRGPVPFSGGSRSLRLKTAGRRKVLLHRTPAGTWKEKYRFLPRPRPLAAFGARCLWHQRSRDSRFAVHWVCARATPTGKLQLFNAQLSRNSRKETIDSSAQLERLLRREFGLELPVKRLKPWKLKRR